MAKKVLFLTFEMPPYIVGGIGSVAYDTTREFKALGYDVTIIGPKDARSFDLNVAYKGIPIHKNVIKFTLMLLKAWYEVIFKKYDFIYCLSGTYPGMVAYMLNKVLSAPYFIVAHGNEFIRFRDSLIFRPLIKRVYKNCQKIFAVSNFTKNNLIDFGISPDKIYTCYNGVDLNKYFPLSKDERREKRKKLGIDDNTFVLLTISRLDKRKGHLNSIKAIEKLKDDKILYLIAGTGKNEHPIKAAISEYHLDDKIRFLGFLPCNSVNDLYNIADLFIMPNIYIEEDGNVEGFGLVFMEAGATKLPSLGGINGGSAEAILDNITGFVVDGNNVTKIAEKIEFCLNNKPQLETMGANAYNRSKDFSWPNIAKKISDIIVNYLQ